MRNLRALQRDPSLVPKGACEVVMDQCLCRLLDRTPSERSEDKLVFLINVRTCALFARISVRENASSGQAPFGSAAERMGIDDESDQVP